MAFNDYSRTPEENLEIGEGIYVGPNMFRNNVRTAIQQLMADGRALVDAIEAIVPGGSGAPPATVTSKLDVAATRSAMASINSTATPVVFLRENGREGLFEWDSAVLIAKHQADTQQGIYVAPNAGANGAWTRRFPDIANVRWFGALGDETTNDRAAFAAADGLGPFMVPPGIYRISTNLTIASDVVFMPGARLLVPSGVTVTINGAVDAPQTHIFDTSGGGNVLLSSRTNPLRYVEWWGGVVDVDCSAAFVQALRAGTVTKLAGRDYVVSSTIQVPAYARLEGVGCDWETGNSATRILMVSPSNTILQLGSTANPTDLNSAPCGATVRDVYVARNQAPTAGAIGVLVGWSRFARMENVKSAESIIGFRFTNTIKCLNHRLQSKRAVPIASGTDQFIGYDLLGTGNLAAAGGNASLFLTECNAECNIPITDSSGFRLTGRITDTFLDWPETVGFSYGLEVVGNRQTSPTYASNLDVTINNAVFDQAVERAIYIRDVNKWGSIKINNPYCSVVGNKETFRASDCDGHIGITGGQFPTTGVATTVAFINCRNPVLDKTAIHEGGGAAVALQNVKGGYIAPVTINCTAVLVAAVQAIDNVTDCTIEPFCQGDASKVTHGYHSLAASNNYNSIRRTGMTRGVVVNKTTVVGGEVNSVLEGIA